MGKGRPPQGSSIVGMVHWSESLQCFATTKGFYWHGTHLGGWKRERPPPPGERKENPKTPTAKDGKQRPRARPPSGNHKVGWTVEFCHDDNCYKSEKNYYWHGTFQGGWKKYKPGEEGEDDDDDHSNKKSRTDPNKPPKGRPPRPKSMHDTVFYDEETYCFKSSSGEYWHGTYKGGWKKTPPRRFSSEKDTTPEPAPGDDTDTESETEEAKEDESNEKKTEEEEEKSI